MDIPSWVEQPLAAGAQPLSVIETAKSRADEPDEVGSLVQAGQLLTQDEKDAIGYDFLVG